MPYTRNPEQSKEQKQEEQPIQKYKRHQETLEGTEEVRASDPPELRDSELQQILVDEATSESKKGETEQEEGEGEQYTQEDA